MNNQEKMEKMQKARGAARLAGSTIFTNPIDKFNASDKTSRKLAINAFCATCKGCMNNYIESGFKAEIRDCTTYSCPLYNFRPYKPVSTT